VVGFFFIWGLGLGASFLAIQALLFPHSCPAGIK